jgi:hypothetical protein
MKLYIYIFFIKDNLPVCSMLMTQRISLSSEARQLSALQIMNDFFLPFAKALAV